MPEKRRAGSGDGVAQQRVRVGIIGANVDYGWGTRAHLPALQALGDQIETVAVCTTRMQTARATAERYGIPLALDDHRELVRRPDVDLVLVCVRVPGHYELTRAALEAGKHVFCEWPLGKNSEEAVVLRDLARARGVRHMVGLQARGAPAFIAMRQRIAAGYVGRVLSATLYSALPGAGQRTASYAWAVDRTQGATTLTIAAGHSLDALCFCLGEFRELSATVATQVPVATITETGATVPVTAPDQVLVDGVLASGAVVSAHIQSVPLRGTGFRFEVYGTEGALVATSDGSAQIGELALLGARGDERALHPLSVEEHRRVPAGVPAGPPLNVAQLFVQLADGIRDGVPVDPDFGVAVTRHQLLDAIQRASDSGQRQRLSPGGA